MSLEPTAASVTAISGRYGAWRSAAKMLDLEAGRPRLFSSPRFLWTFSFSPSFSGSRGLFPFLLLFPVHVNFFFSPSFSGSRELCSFLLLFPAHVDSFSFRSFFFGFLLFLAFLFLVYCPGFSPLFFCVCVCLFVERIATKDPWKITAF